MIEQRDIIALSLMRGIGRRTLLRVLSEMPHGSFDVETLRNVLQTCSTRIDVREVASEFAAAQQRAEAIIETSANAGINVISIRDRDYPRRLAKIEAPPPVIYVKGNPVAVNSSAAVAIIGTRDPTPFGAKCASRLGAAFAQEATVVSGLARGCDAWAHAGCIEAGGTAVAVLAHGLDRIYPRENTELGEAIMQTGGCLLSEYPIGTRPFRSQFVERNKLQAALSDALIVIETDTTGGTMHTVKFALEQRKPIACLKHPEKYAASPQARGNAQLLSRSIATPIADKHSLGAFWKSALLFSGQPSTHTHELELSLNGS